MIDNIKKNSRSLPFLGLLIVFFLPLILAIIIYVTREHWSLESKPHGEIVNPPLRLETTEYPANQRVWRVLYITPKCIGDACALQQAKITSVRDATGKNFDRVDTLFTEGTEIPEGLYIMDPDGNIILKYPLNTPGGYVLDDLRHLLKVSQIG